MTRRERGFWDLGPPPDLVGLQSALKRERERERERIEKCVCLLTSWGSGQRCGQTGFVGGSHSAIASGPHTAGVGEAMGQKERG